MIYLVHGDDLAKSRALITAQQKKLNIEKRTEFNLTDTTIAEILNVCNSNDLFGGTPFVVVEISKAAKSELDSLADMLGKIQDACTLIILSEKELTKTNPLLLASKNLAIKTNMSNKSLEGNVFNFVDELLKKNRQKAYTHLETLYKENADSFYIFSMILFGLRNIAHVIFESPNLAKMNPFVKNKAVSIAKQYSNEKISFLISEMYKLDKKVKTGQIDADVMVTLAMEKVLNS